MTLLVTTFLWSGARAWRPGVFKPAHVAGLARMVAANLTVPHRFVCVSDVEHWEPLRALGIEPWPLWSWPRAAVATYGGTDSWVRLGLLGQPGEALAAETGCRAFLSLDLDTIIRGNIDNIAAGAARRRLSAYWSQLGRLALLPTGHRRGFQGCLLGGKLGASPDIWEACSDLERCELAAKTYVGSDQALLTHMRPTLPTWDERDGMVLERNVVDVPDWRVLFFFGGDHAKPWNHPQYGRLYSELTGVPLDPRRFPQAEEFRINQRQRLRRFRE